MVDNNVNQTGLATLMNLVQAVYNLSNIDSAGAASLVTALAAINTTLAAAFPPVLTSSVTYNPPSLTTLTQATTTVTVAGAALGNWADASFSLDQQGITVTAYVSAANTVTVVFFNGTAGTLDLASGTLKARVWSH